MKKTVFLVLLTGFILWFWGINYPFTGTYNANNNYLTLAAKNYLRFGFTTLKFFPTYFAGQSLPSPVPYYLHHPILIFILSAIPFMIFGFHNWVVHVTNLLFLLGDIFLIYRIGMFVWNKRIGLWAAALAAIFPMTAIFWKYIFFEQGSLFFNLLVIYNLLVYFQKPKLRYLFYIFLFTFISGLVDWGVLYLFIPMLVFGRKVLKPLVIYVSAAALSIGLFLVSVYLLRGGFGELRQAISVHSYTPQLFQLSFWPLRLLLISILRFLIYFTPLSLLWFRFAKKNRILLFFLIFGVMNILILPTVTWENSYFLFYFIPFLAFSGALWMQSHKNVWVVLLIIVSSVTVSYFKLEQVKKQFWQYDAAVNVSRRLAPYETVGVVNFSGDILEQYFLHPTVPLARNSVYPRNLKIVVAGKLIDTNAPLPAPATSSATTVVKWYRIVRDFFNVGQL